MALNGGIPAEGILANTLDALLTVAGTGTGTGSTNGFTRLPPEILNFQILEQCDRNSLANIRGVSRGLEEIVTPVLFESIALGSEKDHDEEVERVKALLESELSSNIGTLSISSRILKRDEELIWEFPPLKPFLEKISPQIRNLTLIANHPETVWDRPGNDIDGTVQTAERFLWMMGSILEDISFPNLKAFNIHVDCPRQIIRLIQKSRPREGVSWQYAGEDEDWNPTRALFPTIQHLGVYIALGDEEFECAEYEYFEPAVRLLAFGCTELTSLEAAIWEYTIRDDIHDAAQDNYFDISTTGIDLSNDLSKLKRFSLRSGRQSEGGTPLQRMLEPMVNLEVLKLNNIQVRPPPQEGNEDQLDVHNNWKDVFNFCKEYMPKLKEYYFMKCFSDDMYQEFATEYGVPTVPYKEGGWGGPTQKFLSSMKEEIDALESLKGTISGRRKDLGLSEEW